VGKYEWEFIYPPKYYQLMDKFGEGVKLWERSGILWEGPEMKQWLVQNVGEDPHPKSSYG